jgi:hypothetical protein
VRRAILNVGFGRHAAIKALARSRTHLNGYGRYDLIMLQHLFIFYESKSVLVSVVFKFIECGILKPNLIMGKSKERLRVKRDNFKNKLHIHGYWICIRYNKTDKFVHRCITLTFILYMISKTICIQSTVSKYSTLRKI